jgi:DNA-binding PadR family transcriptional regulator
MLDELGHARSNEQEGRRVYEITDTGRADLESHRDEVEDFYARLRDDSWDSHIESLGEVMRHLGRLIKTFKRASRRGRLSATKLTKTREIIDEAVSKLEKVFEEDD